MLTENAVDQINKILDDSDFAWNKLKSMKLNWEYVAGFWLPVLDIQFYEERKENV